MFLVEREEKSLGLYFEVIVILCIYKLMFLLRINGEWC